MKIRKIEPGFTLIEMMVVIGVFGILAAIAIPAFMSMLPGMRLNGATRQVMGDLMAARMKAVKENNNYKIFFNSPSSNQYQILDDDNNNDAADTNEGLTTEYIQTEPDEVTPKYHDVIISSSTNDPVFTSRGTIKDFSSVPTIVLQNSSGTKTISGNIAGHIKID